MTHPIDISPDQLEIVCNILRKYLPSNIRVWVFGSRAKWTTHDGSDLDLAVEGDQPIDHDIMININIEFDDSDLPYKVDVIDLKTVNKKFKEIVNRQKILLPSTNSNDHWNEIRLENFAPFVYGKPLPASQRNSSGGIPVVGSGGIIGYHDVGLTNKPTIVIGRKGTAGSVHYFSGPCWPIDTTFYVTGDDPLLMRFKYYLLKTLGLERMNSDSAVPGLNRDAAHARSLRIPNKQEQKKIAHVLGSLDMKIDLNHRMNQALEDMARVLFKSWFVDFDPVRTKMDGRWRPGESLPGLPSRLYDLFPDQLVDSELGEIPEGWTISVVKNCLNLTLGQSPPSKTYNDECKGIPFFQDSTDFGLRYPRNRKYCTAPTRIASADDTLVSVRAPVGAMNMAWEECCVGRGVAALRHKTGSRSFTYYLAWSLQQDLKQYDQMGTVFGAITKNQLEMMPMVEPPHTVVNHFEAYVSTWDERIRRSTLESRLLTLQQNFLLPKLMSGKIRI